MRGNLRYWQVTLTSQLSPVFMLCFACFQWVGERGTLWSLEAGALYDGVRDKADSKYSEGESS
jgi:hypothetical protein